MSEYQVAYRIFHFSETALLRVQNDILVSVDSGHSTALFLLDLSTAFNTIDHNLLLHCLKHWYGITSCALSSLSSFLTNRFETVVASDLKSQAVLLEFDIPQGSILGPLLYSLYFYSILLSQNTLASIVISSWMILKYIFHFPLNMHHSPYLLLSLASKMFSLG